MLYIDNITDYTNDLNKIKNNKVFIKSRTTKKDVEIPCCNTFLIKRELIQANDYNPNSVSNDKMNLLKESIIDNGFCFPIVVIHDDNKEKFVIIDGFHRYTILGSDWLEFDYIPAVILEHDISKRMIATVAFNKARGVHSVELDSELIRKLIDQGLEENEIAVKLGIDIDTVFRYKQLTGIAELFKNNSYSTSWDMVEINT